jgi:perosamine synthetase
VNIPQYVPYIGDEEKEALCRCIDDQWITSGKRVAEFEQRIAKLCDVKHAVTVSNGTVAIYAMLKACGVQPGDHVIVPDFTFIATASMVVMARAKPIFADIDPVSLCITPESIDKVMTDKVTAVMPVGMYGQCSRWDEIREYCYSKSIMMIEDSAQDIGVFYKKKAVGTYGVAGTFSFYADKVITSCGEGGMVITDSTEIYHKVLRQKFHGNTAMGKYIHDQAGWNFRMTDTNAAVGLAQLNKLGFIIKKKKENEAKLKALLKDISQVRFMDIDMMCENVPFRNVIFVPEAKPLIEYLVDKGVMARPLFYPMHRQPPFLSYVDMPVTDKVNREGLSLPSSVALTDKEIGYVCDAIKEFYKNTH